MTRGRPGERLGDRYVLQSFLGAGAYGEVWKAEDTNRGHVVALKLLLDGDRKGAWAEASLLTALESPHILKVNNADVIVDVPYLDTELARGSLDTLAAPVGMEPQRVVAGMRRVLTGLSLCHSRGLLHRDVKPANIFEDLQGDVCLGDFGAAAFMDGSGTASLHGDPHIRAPESYSTQRTSILTDVYGAAISMYALLTNRWPYDEQMEADLASKIRAGRPTSIRDLAPHVSRALGDVIGVGMAVDPAARFSTAAAFDAALGNLPSRTSHFAPIPAHGGHSRCWQVTGRRSLDVCVVESAGACEVTVLHSASGRRLSGACATVESRQVVRHLRTLFDSLRAGRL